MSSPMIVFEVEPPADWEAYARARGSFYHLPQWAECLRDTYRLRIEYLSARNHWWPGCAEGLEGMMAVAEVPPLLGPRRLVSLPFSYAAGPLASSPATAEALVGALRDHARDLGIPRVEIKSRGEYPPTAGYHRTRHYTTYEVPTGGGEAEVWGRLHPGSTQRSIRKGEKAGVTVRRGDTVKDWLMMAQLEERTAHSHGLPPPPRRFFTEGCRRLQSQGLADVYLAFTRAGKRAAAITVWKGPRAWIYGFGASDPYTPPELIAQLDALLRPQLEYRYLVHSAEHGYALPDRDIHDKHASNRDWERIFAMFRRRLHVPTDGA
jgi:hypothetical protein